ncbi:MAG: proprotein convertase P-domain-containing protein [Marinicellaceae bacterium]
MKIQYTKQIISFVVLMVSMSLVWAEGEKGDVIYTDKGVPIKFGSVIVSEAIPSLTRIPARDAPIISQWRPGDAIKEIPRIHWNEAKVENLSQRSNDRNSQRDPLLEKQANSPGYRSPDPGAINMNGQGFSGANPPDTVGDVGMNYYIQAINSSGSSVVIYNKDGSVAVGPFSMESLGGGNCASGFGDPIVLYDEMAGRWMISEFSSSGNQLCVYISQTGDPTGSYYAYAFTASNSFPDYPKYGVWPNAYYMGSNESEPTLYAFDRANMLQGNAATLQSFNASGLAGFGFQMLTPADLDGSTPPDANAPGLFLRHRDTESHGAGSCPNAGSGDCIEIFEFDVDWATPGNSSLTGPTMIEVTDFDSNLCGLTSFNCFPQSGSGTTLDPLREVMMWRVAYRNFGSHESIVGNLVTDVDGTDHGGIRWIELRNTGLGWTLHDEGTFAPDAESRWMGSAAMDESGNIAIAYNKSSPSTFPSLAYTGRLSTDAAGTMGTEETIVTGTSANGSNRWGDYAALSIDPADGCTFWFTGQYSPASQWSTRITNFSFPECGASGFNMNGTNLTQSVCVDPSADINTITLDLAPLNGFSETVNLAFDPGLPTGFSSSGGFTPSSLTPPGSSSVDISIDNTATSGANNFQITGTSTSATKSVDVSVFITDGLPAQTSLLTPANASTSTSSPTFSWTAVADTADYTLEIATDSGFSNIVYTTTQSATSLDLPVALAANTTNYWRVTANNGCGSGVVSSTFSFDTPSFVCFSTPSAIPDDSAAGLTTTINFGSAGNITNLLVTTDVSHTYVGDLIFSLEHENTGTTVELMNRPGRINNGFGCGSDNVNTVFDDSSINVVEDQCNGTPPAIGPDSLPDEALSNFDGLNAIGNWNLTISDNANDDTGDLNEWCLDLSLDPIQTYTVSGDVMNATGSVTVLNMGGNAQTIPLNGPFSFSPQSDGTPYSVTVSDSPATQTCNVINGSGTLSGSNVSNVVIDCSTNTYTVSGNVSGASGSVTVVNNGTNAQVIANNGSFNFPAQNDGTGYAVTVDSFPATQDCSVTNGTGTLAGLNVNNVAVVCADDFSIAVADMTSVLEDSGVNSIDVLLNDTSGAIDASPITSVTQPANGTVVITNGGDDLSYEPDANFCHDGQTTDDFTYTITGGSSASVSVTVDCVNDEPSFANDNDVYVRLSDIGNPLDERVACQFDMGANDENTSQNVSDIIVSIDSDPNGILSSIDVLNDGSLTATYTGTQGIAIISLILQDDGGTNDSGDDTSDPQQFNIRVEDYIFKGTFEIETCPQLDI